MRRSRTTREVSEANDERVRRIELPSSAWKAEVLAFELHPLEPTRLLDVDAGAVLGATMRDWIAPPGTLVDL